MQVLNTNLAHFSFLLFSHLSLVFGIDLSGWKKKASLRNDLFSFFYNPKATVLMRMLERCLVKKKVRVRVCYLNCTQNHAIYT